MVNKAFFDLDISKNQTLNTGTIYNIQNMYTQEGTKYLIYKNGTHLCKIIPRSIVIPCFKDYYLKSLRIQHRGSVSSKAIPDF